MSKPTDTSIKSVTSDTQRIVYRTPIKFGGRVVDDVLLLNVSVDVETRDGRRATGHGSMPLGNVWAWPTSQLDGVATLAAMQRFGERIVEIAGGYQGCGHPLETAHDLATSYEKIAPEVVQELNLSEPMPKLAQLVAASPLDAALHDAYGRVHNSNAYNLLGETWVNSDLASYLTDEFKGEYLDQYTSRTPKPTIPIYHLVGALDPLSDEDVTDRPDDDLPCTLGEWIVADGLTHLKIKLAGDDLAWDVSRVVGVEKVSVEAQQTFGRNAWHYSLDFNEKCQSVEYVLEFLAKLADASPEAFDRVQYIEQPTHRDLRSHPDNRMHEAAKIKPVVIDESLVDLESLQLAREQGYSGVALKACKGHSDALLMGAAAQKYGMFLCVQDLTCPGASFLHSASLAARIPTIAAIEGNGRQYCPAGNIGWQDLYPGMFEVTDGSVATALLDEIGLGFDKT